MIKNNPKMKDNIYAIMGWPSTYVLSGGGLQSTSTKVTNLLDILNDRSTSFLDHELMKQIVGSPYTKNEYKDIIESINFNMPTTQKKQKKKVNFAEYKHTQVKNITQSNINQQNQNTYEIPEANKQININIKLDQKKQEIIKKIEEYQKSYDAINTNYNKYSKFQTDLLDKISQQDYFTIKRYITEDEINAIISANNAKLEELGKITYSPEYINYMTEHHEITDEIDSLNLTINLDGVLDPNIIKSQEGKLRDSINELIRKVGELPFISKINMNKGSIYRNSSEIIKNIINDTIDIQIININNFGREYTDIIKNIIDEHTKLDKVKKLVEKIKLFKTKYTATQDIHTKTTQLLKKYKLFTNQSEQLEELKRTIIEDNIKLEKEKEQLKSFLQQQQQPNPDLSTEKTKIIEKIDSITSKITLLQQKLKELIGRDIQFNLSDIDLERLKPIAGGTHETYKINIDSIASFTNELNNIRIFAHKIDTLKHEQNRYIDIFIKTIEKLFEIYVFLKIKLYIYNHTSFNKNYLDRSDIDKIKLTLETFDTNINYFGFMKLYIDKIIGQLKTEKYNYIYIDKSKISILDVLIVKFFI